MFDRLGFSLLEISLTMIVGLTLTGVAAYYYNDAIKTTKHASLKNELHETRKAIDKFYKSNGRYPDKLSELTVGPHVYLRSLPNDPTTSHGKWIIVMESGETCLSDEPYTGVYDIRSTNPQFMKL